MSLRCRLFGHAGDLRERTADGYALICQRCGMAQVVLPDQVLRVKARAPEDGRRRDEQAIREREIRLAQMGKVREFRRRA